MTMGSCAKPLWGPEEGQDYVFKSDEFVIKSDNTFEEILLHMMGEIEGSPEERLGQLEAILGTIPISEIEEYLKRYEL
jgi:hypothetical protein